MEDDKAVQFAGCFYSGNERDVLRVDGTSAGLRHQSVEVFRYLAENCDRVVSRDELVDNIWGDIEVTDDSLTKCISEIRKALKDSKKNKLKTIYKRGYQLIADEESTHTISDFTAVGNGTSTTSTLANRQPESVDAVAATAEKKYHRFGFLFLALLMTVAFYYLTAGNLSPNNPAELNAPAYPSADGVPLLKIRQIGDNNSGLLVSDSLIPELRVALNPYKTVTIVSEAEHDLELLLRHDQQASAIIAELLETGSGKILFTESYGQKAYSGSNTTTLLARRISASIASPGVGAIDRHLLDSTKLIPANQLSNAACYAHGYGCSKCSGEEDSITRRAEVCLKAILEKDPDDARAWALQATINAHQYWWANTLPEPARSDPSLRTHLPAMAIESANKAEALSDGSDTAVYWGMAEAYYSACEADKLKTAVDRGLEINPHDPNLLGAFGNWLAYSGRWDEGAALTLRAMEIEPRRYRKWWWMGPAKAAYFHRDYKQAYEYFLKAFNERNWMSHLQLAYTLPHLDRIDDARKSAKTLQYMYPGFTREKALEIYRLLCFPDSFLKDINQALELAGLPSRGNSDDLANISLPRAKVVTVNGVDVEYLDVGKGEAVVFVHGAFNDYRSWGHYMVPISEDHRYISYSRRYFGTQDWKDSGENYSVEVFASDLIALIETLNLDGVHLVSWSSGVRTALAVAVMRPDLVKSTIHFEPVENNVMQELLTDSNIAELQKNWNSGYGPVMEHLKRGDEEGALRKMYETVFEVADGAYETEREMFREVTRQNARSLTVNMTKYNADQIKLTCDYVAQVKAPTLIVHGEETNDYWKLMAARYAECTPNAALASIEGSNHYAPIQKIDEFGKLIIDFVEENR